MPTGRFAPSPTGPLHVGNLRTALLAWLFARRDGGRFLMRIEDLDRVASRSEHEASQLADLAAIGIDWDQPVTRQSERFDRYGAAIDELERRDLLYRCYCTRREIAAAAQAPHGPLPEGAYPGTCRELTTQQRHAHERDGRPAALRVDAQHASVTIHDDLVGDHTGVVDDFVVRRNDGTPAYNLAVVVDDAAQGIEQVVRGDDLLESTPRQVWLAQVLGLDVPRHAHVPLVLGPDGERLTKRHGAVTLADLRAEGVSAADLLAALAQSIGVDLTTDAAGDARAAVHALGATFDPGRLSPEPWTFDPRTIRREPDPAQPA